MIVMRCGETVQKQQLRKAPHRQFAGTSGVRISDKTSGDRASGGRASGVAGIVRVRQTLDVMNQPLRLASREKHIDDADIDPADLAETMACLRTINRRAGGISSILQQFRAWSANWPKDQPVRILDLCTGSADIPLAIAQWAQDAGFDVRIVAVDHHPGILRVAAEYLEAKPAAGRIQLLQADLFNLPFEPNSFDYVMCSAALHHFPQIRVLTALRIMERLMTRGLLWSDMHRGFWPELCVSLALTGKPAKVRHDGLAAAKSGFTRAEVRDIASRLDMGYLRYQRHFVYRFVLAGERKGAWRLP